jgi:bifunctional DNase/RNase
MQGKGGLMLIEMKVFGLTIDPFTNAPIVILKDIDEKNSLPVWIGVLEASAIASELEHIKFSRPMTHDLLKCIIQAAKFNVKRIEINDLKDNVYYAIIHIDSGDGSLTLDARPSDAIALSLRTGSPIFVDKDVLDKSKTIDLRKTAVKDGEAEALEKDSPDNLEKLAPENFGKYKM